MRRNTEIALLAAAAIVAYYYKDAIAMQFNKLNIGWTQNNINHRTAPQLSQMGSTALGRIQNKDYHAFSAGIRRDKQLYPRAI